MEEEVVEVVALIVEVGEEDMEAEATGVVEGSEVGRATVATGRTRRVLRLAVQTE